MLSSLFASLSAKIAGVALAAVAATGGLAAAGALPAPAQQAVANVASTVGISIPTPHTEAPEHPAVTGTVTSTVGDDEASPTSTAREANESTTATVHDAKDTTATVQGDAVVNHGHCVSYAAGIAESLGLSGSMKGQFVSTVAQDSSAVSASVSQGGKPDAACQAAIDKAKTSATSPGRSDDSHGKGDGVTSTVTATATPGEDGHGSNPHANATSNPGSSHKP